MQKGLPPVVVKRARQLECSGVLAEGGLLPCLHWQYAQVMEKPENRLAHISVVVVVVAAACD